MNATIRVSETDLAALDKAIAAERAKCGRKRKGIPRDQRESPLLDDLRGLQRNMYHALRHFAAIVLDEDGCIFCRIERQCHGDHKPEDAHERCVICKLALLESGRYCREHHSFVETGRECWQCKWDREREDRRAAEGKPDAR